MPSIQVHGQGSGASSPVPGAKFGKINNNLTAMQEKAAADAMQSANPWASDRFKKANAGIERMINDQARKAEAAAKASMSSTVPWMSPVVRGFGQKLEAQIKRDAQRDYTARTKEFSDNARFARQMSAVRERQQRAAFGQSYREAADLNRRYDATSPATYQAAQARAFGVSGASGNWRQYGAAQRGLNAMSSNAHPRVQAAVRAARMALAGNRSGGGMVGKLASTPGGSAALEMLEAVGIDVGEFATAGLAGPVGVGALLAYKAARAAAQSPYTLANMANGVMGGASSYMSLRGQYAGIGRAAGLDSRDIESQFSSDNPRLNALGIGPTEGARIMSQYGISPYSAKNAAWTAETIGRQQYAGSLGGLGTDRYAASANFARNAGFARFNGSEANGLQSYFSKLQAITSVAVSQGMDRSQSISNVENLLRSAAGAGSAGMSVPGITDMAARLMQAGTPGGRSGASAASILEASRTTAGQFGFGGANLQNSMLGSYVQNAGGVGAFASDDAIKKLVGASTFDNLNQTPGGRQRIADIKLAARSGNAMSLNDALGNVLADNPAAQERAYSGSVYGKTLPSSSYLGIVAHRNVMNLSASADADQRGTANFPTSVGPRISGLGAGPRGMRNLNPLSLKYVPGQGAIGADSGGFGVYGSMESGIAADTRQITLYQDKYGLNTVRGIISRWAPPGDGNDTASYIAQVCQALGVGPDTPINTHDAATAQKMVMAMARRENGVGLDAGTAQRGVAMGLGLPFTPGTSPYASIADPQAGNTMADINTALARTDQLNVNTGRLNTGMATGALSGDAGRLAINTSNMATRIDSYAISKGSDVFNGLVSAVSTSVGGLSALTDAAHAAAAALGQIRYANGQGLTGQSSPSPMRH